MHVPPPVARVLARAGPLYHVPRNTVCHTRTGNHGNTRTDRCVSHGTRSRVSAARTSRRDEIPTLARLLLDRGRPRLSVDSLGLVGRPRTPTVTPEGADGMAVGTHKLALAELAKDLFSRPTPKIRADVADLLEPGKVIPLHRLWTKDAPAIAARPSSLQALQPCPARGPVRRPRPRPSRKVPTDPSLVSLVVDLSAAWDAVDLPAIRSQHTAMAGGAWLGIAATGATLHVRGIRRSVLSEGVRRLDEHSRRLRRSGQLHHARRPDPRAHRPFGRDHVAHSSATSLDPTAI